MYQALYRKYRPMSFDDVVSQPQVTRTLINQLKTGKTAHAYIFTGSRGTGKTTCARILAKALNCLHPVDGNPCLECEVCRDADSGALGDIIEIDAASNSGVDDIRDLRDSTAFLPERCKYKVYIIDEVHMLSAAAFNALLKIMEEPPPHVKFILATTEIHKVLPTILSRCQRFDFRRIKPADIAERLLSVAEQESFTLTEDAAMLIAKASDGGMRDALSLLDRCTAYSDDITADVAASAAGIAGSGHVFRILSAVAEHNTAEAVKAVGELYDLSKDMQQLCTELISQMRNVMLAKAVPENKDILNCLPSETEQVEAIAAKMTEDEIFSGIDILRTANERMSRASSMRVEMEMCAIKLCSKRNAASADNSEIYAKLDMLERKLQNAPSSPAANNSNNNIRSEPAYAQPVSAPAKPAVKNESIDPSQFTPVERWDEILEEYKKSCPSGAAALVGSYATEKDGRMLIYSENTFFLSVIKAENNAVKLQEAIMKITGQKYRISAKCTAAADAPKNNNAAELIKKAQENGIPTDES